ncbi:arginine deiminase-related protein [soil metagenome]
MLTRDPTDFFAFARTLPIRSEGVTAKAAFLVAPEQFQLAAQSASDNHYMDLDVVVDPQRAAAQHRGLQQTMSTTLPTICFPGDSTTPDAIFPNNVFATVPGTLILCHMRHPVRQAERARSDIRGFFRDTLGYAERDLGLQPGICELTGSLVIDHARGIGYCGLSERCDAIGAQAMLDAFGLHAILAFDLAPGEYHTNVVLSVLAGRAVVLSPDGFADATVADAIAGFYAPATVRLTPIQKQAFAANCVALSPSELFMSERAQCNLTDAQRDTLHNAGFQVRAVALDELEKAGGSLRCCVAELY